MGPSIHIRITHNDQLLFGDTLQGPIELGRQRQREQGGYQPVKEAGHWRLSIARPDELDVSRRHALIEPLGDGRVRITNLSEVQSIGLANGPELTPRAAPCEQTLPLVLTLGGRIVQLSSAAAAEPETDQLESLDTLTIAPGAPLPAIAFGNQAEKLDLEEVLRWMQTAVSVLQSAASSSDFFDHAAKAALDLVGLDSGLVLLLKNGVWQPEASFPPRPANRPLSYSRRVLDRVRAAKRTFWQVPSHSGTQEASLMNVRAVVAAPILDRQGNVIGALYGERNTGSAARPSTPISRLEAMLVELLATGVANGLARLEQEKAALTARVQFEQFFTPELAHHLTQEPDLLKGRDADVTLLFMDIRQFSRHSEKLGPSGTDQWIGDVMDSFAEPVQATQGVLVDYRGDEMIAMWGAPKSQPDHAARAARCALAMLDQLDRLNERWAGVLGEPMDIGIGINSGPARVGNTGSQRKFKYGPHGPTVNVASRVQGATKYLKVRVLITGTTQQGLDSEFATRCLGRVRVVNIAEPVALYELAAPGRANWATLEGLYREAQADFEQKEFRKVIRTLGNLLAAFPDDGPALVLLARAVNFLVQEPAKVDTVWELPGK